MVAVMRRTREIGIRKVLDAGITHVVRLFSMEYIILVFFASLLACRAAYYTMQRWLQNSAYHIHLDFMPFILGGILTLTVALVTVGYHAVRIASTNPVDVLRNE